MPKAILSVYDKTGLVDFARGLADLGWELIASGGTARMLIENNIAVTQVEAYTGSPEILGGRVKTLHPAIHGGLLARDTDEDLRQLADLGWSAIDLVAVNLYPFEDTIARPDVTRAEAIEQIDIGGVTLIRAAAKNSERVTLVCDPADYGRILDLIKNGAVPLDVRQELAVKGFCQTMLYDTAISNYLMGKQVQTLSLYPIQELRYGENPHQKAILYGNSPGDTPLGGQVLQGKELSYNNILDLDVVWRAALAFEKTTVCIVKHLSPCGIACADTVVEAYKAALASDPVSAFGGLVACNREIDEAAAEAITAIFVECVVAPAFSPEAREVFLKKKNLRLVQISDPTIREKEEYRSVIGGMLKQEIDFGDPADTVWKVVTKHQPTDEEMESLRFAWKACQHVKSNAIVFAKGEATIGIGGGQPNRVDCVRIAAERAGEKSNGAVMASDAFFPFPDAVEEANKAGIIAIVQPGGSIRDDQSIAAADKYNIAMVTTGVRHFRH